MHDAHLPHVHNVAMNVLCPCGAKLSSELGLLVRAALAKMWINLVSLS